MSQSTDPVQQAKDIANSLTDQTQAKSNEVMGQAKDTAVKAIEGQKGRAADSIGNVAEALRETGKQLNEHDQQAFGRIAETAADRLEQFSNDLQNKDFNDILDDVEDFARRDPQLFLGGAVVLGLLAARFLKSSNRRSRRYEQPMQQQFPIERRGYTERGPAGYPAGEGYRQGFSRPYAEQGRGDYRPGSYGETNRTSGPGVYEAPPRTENE